MFVGSFVASAGLESFVTHGFLTPAEAVAGKKNDKLELVVDFVRDNLTSYARAALPFLSDAYCTVQQEIVTSTTSSKEPTDFILNDLRTLDDLYEAMTLNHVARRASKTQGVALLSLYSKGFTKPSMLREASQTSSGLQEDNNNAKFGALVDRLKLAIRREETHGHLPICWGVLTAALGLSLGANVLYYSMIYLRKFIIFMIFETIYSERSQFLHLFLYARGLLSAGVRMNTLGPYAAQQLLLHAIRPLVTTEAKQCGMLRTGLQTSRTVTHGVDAFDGEVLTHKGPAMTWPLGEILAGRHDLQHSRVFNS